MEEITIFPEVPRILRRLSLASVQTLLEYLDQLSNNRAERSLTWEEDERAIYILNALVPADSDEIKACNASFVDPRFRSRRTLAQWYAYARHVAKLIENGD